MADRVAVVTGAASGIGRGVALELASRGADLVLADLDVERLAPVAAEVERRGRRASVHACDVRRPEHWSALKQATLDVHGAAHVLVNNAGVALTGPFLACSDDDLRWQLDVNLWGVVHGCRTFLPVLREQAEAHVVNISSIFGVISVPDSAAYCMSKHAVKALTEALESELWGGPVRFTVVHPGAVATNIVVSGRYRDGGFASEDGARELIAAGMHPDEAGRRIVRAILTGRRRLVLGRDAKVLDLIQRIAPVRYRHLVRAFLRRRGARS